MKNLPGNIKLSICIPTYNRARFIGETIESVICQAEDNIEIVVVDGASTDNTEEVIRSYQKEFGNLVYSRREKNYGVDRDMARSIELARGKYCWMLSDDDLLNPGAIKRILKEIGSECEIYLCNTTICDLHMRPLRERLWFSRKIKDRFFNLHDKKEFIEYCENANSIGALFSYMSSIVLRREEWDKAGFDRDFDGSAYALASSLFSSVTQKCRLKYIRTPLVLCRNDNESFSNSKGLVKRFLLDFDGYLRLADKHFAGDKNSRKSFLKVMTREHPWYTVVHVVSLIADRRLWLQFKGKLITFGYNPAMIELCRFFSRNQKMVAIAVGFKRKIVRNGIYLWLNKQMGRITFS